jgi:hypothetical protein
VASQYRPTTVSTWPTVLTPDAMTPDQEVLTRQYYSLGLAPGEVQTSHTLPTYNPGVPPLRLLYSSTAAEVVNQGPVVVLPRREDRPRGGLGLGPLGGHQRGMEVVAHPRRPADVDV